MADGPAKHILIIDDDEDFRDPIEIVLGSRGYRVRCASNGDQGVRMAAEEPPDLILLDFLMPVKNGLETSLELQELPGMGRVPILGLTAFGDRAIDFYGEGSVPAPANIRGYLEKPVEFDVLLERVALALAGREIERAS